MKLDLHNKTLRVGVNASPPFVFLQWDPRREAWQSDGGVEMRLVDSLSEYFNFSYELINCNNNWGTLQPNNTWNGLIGLLTQEKADIGVGGISLTYDRARAVPFLYPHIVTSVTFITPAPSVQPNIYLVFKPLALDVWMGFLMSLLACVLFDLLYNRLHPATNYVKVFWISLYSMFRQQYNTFVPDTTSLNTWMFFWSVSTFVLTTGYAGCLCSLITVPLKMRTIDTVQDLYGAAKSGKVIVTGIASSAYTDALINSQLSIYKELASILKPVKTKNEGFEAVGRQKKRKKPHAFISMRESLRYGQLLYGESAIYITPDISDASLFIDLLIMPVRGSFEYSQHFDLAIARLVAAGIVQHWKEDQNLKLAKPKTSATQGGDQFEEFSISHLQSFFYVYIFSTIVSILFFIIEFLYFACTRCRGH